MKFNIDRMLFVNALQKIQSVLESNPTQSVLNNVLLTCEKDNLHLTATDSLITLNCMVEAEVQKKGTSTLPARRLFGLVRELSDRQVTVEIDEKHVAQIRCGASSSKLFGFAADDFPKVGEIREDKAFSIEQEIFKQMLSKTVYAVSDEQTRAILNGVFLRLRDQKITAVATDGRRLAVVEQELDILKDVEGDVVVPTKAVNELIRCLGNEGKLTVRMEPKRVMFETNNIRLISKLIEGEYPNYQQVIPSHFEERITVEREEMLAALRRAHLMTSEKYPSVKTRFLINEIQISAINPEVGEAYEVVPVKYSGKEITAAFNPDFVMDPLKNLTSDEVYLEIIDDTSPIVIKCDIPFLYVVMPLRVDS